MMLTERAPEATLVVAPSTGGNTSEVAFFWLVFASAASIVFSIAVSQILMGASLLLLVLRRVPITWPPIKLPLALFCAWTVASVVFSGHAIEGLPQIRKFFVFAMLALVPCAFRNATQVRNLFLTWVSLGLLSAMAGFFHVFARYREAVRLKWNSYDFYLDDRIKGFTGHWMTFGGEQMIILLILLAYLLFACPRSHRVPGWCGAAILWASLLLGLTRSIFLLGVPIGTIYLLAAFKPATLTLIPVVAVMSWTVAPFQVRERIKSAISPHGELDSNKQRSVSRRAGWEMIKAHPWFGLGPEQIKPQFEKYVPRAIPRPLPHGWYGHLHNIYLQYCAERGVPALIFLLWMIFRMLIDFTRVLRLRRISPDGRWIVHAAVAVIGAILAEGFFEHNLGDSEVLTMFLVVASSSYVVIGTESHLCS